MKSREQRKHGVVWIMLLLCLIGFFVALYLTFQHYVGAPVQCASGCEVVTTSEYSTVLGFPISLFGALYFLGLIGLLFGFLQHQKKSFEIVAEILIAGGATVACTLIAIQLFVLDAICVYCMTADSISIVLVFLFFYKRSYI